MRSYLRWFTTIILKVVSLLVGWLPIKRDRILFIGIEGGGANEYSCNPMYICEELLRFDSDKFQICWLVRDRSQYEELKLKGIYLAKHFTIKAVYYCWTSKVIISNGGYASWFPFRKKQVFINTWHGGGAYKKLENDKKDTNFAVAKSMEFCGRNIDYFLSSSKLFTKYVVRGVFKYKGEVLEIGMPRNDMLLKTDNGVCRKKVEKFYSIDAESKIVLYAPTFREKSDIIFEDINFTKLMTSLSKRFGGEWVVIARGHYNGNDRLIKYDDKIFDGSVYKDMQELLCASDVLVTDYSSCVWDFSLTKKPIFLYTPDLKEYTSKVGFYVPVEKWHFPIAKSNSALNDKIVSFDLEIFKEDVKYHHSELGNCETGQATKIIKQLIDEICFGKGEKINV